MPISVHRAKFECRHRELLADPAALVTKNGEVGSVYGEQTTSPTGGKMKPNTFWKMFASAVSHAHR